MSELFGREVAITAGTVKITGLRCAFKVEQTLKPEPNKAEVSIWNLSEATRASLRGVVVPVTLEAGYVGTRQVVFKGDIAADGVISTRDGPDWVTTLRAGDGEDLYRRTRVQESFAEGTKIKDVLAKLLGKFGDSAKEAFQKAKAGDFSGALDTFVGGAVMSGPAHDELTKLLAANGYTWSFQDGKVQILKAGEANTEPAVLLSSSTGLLGSPEIGKGGVLKFRSLLQPGLRPGRKVKIQSREIHGAFFVVGKVVHTGDTHGNDWLSEVDQAVAL